MNVTTRITIIISILITLSSAATTQASENAGVNQEVKINIDRNLEDKTAAQKTELYCRQQNITFCQDDPTPIEIIVVTLDMEDLYTNIIPTDNNSNIQTISTPTKPSS
jgi:hypothetical protein